MVAYRRAYRLGARSTKLTPSYLPIASVHINSPIFQYVAPTHVLLKQ